MAPLFAPHSSIASRVAASRTAASRTAASRTAASKTTASRATAWRATAWRAAAGSKQIGGIEGADMLLMGLGLDQFGLMSAAAGILKGAETGDRPRKVDRRALARWAQAEAASRSVETPQRLPRGQAHCQCPVCLVHSAEPSKQPAGEKVNRARTIAGQSLRGRRTTARGACSCSTRLEQARSRLARQSLTQRGGRVSSVPPSASLRADRAAGATSNGPIQSREAQTWSSYAEVRSP